MYLKKIIVFICVLMFFFKGYSSDYNKLVEYIFLDKDYYIPQIMPFNCEDFNEKQQVDYYKINGQKFYINAKPISKDSVDNVYTNSIDFLLKNKFTKLENLVLFWDDNLSFDFLMNYPSLKTLHIITHSNLNGDFTKAKKKIKNLNIKVSFESFSLVNLPNLKGVDVAILNVFFLPWQLLLDKNLPKKIETEWENRSQNENLFFYLGLKVKKLRREGEKPITVNKKLYNPVPKNGKYTLRHKNGKLFFKGKFKKGLPDGQWVFYNDSGEVLEERQYNKGKAVGEWYAYGFNVSELSITNCGLTSFSMKANFNKDTLKKVILNARDITKKFDYEGDPPYIIDSTINVYLFDSSGKYCISHLYERYDDLGILITKITQKGKISYLPYLKYFQFLAYSRNSFDTANIELMFKNVNYIKLGCNCNKHYWISSNREINCLNNNEIKYMKK